MHIISEYPIGSVISVNVAPIGSDRMRRFRDATRSTHSPDFLPSLPTIFREAEFQWLDRLSIDWHQLLHAEQNYEYLSLVPCDRPLTMTTLLANVRVRKLSSGSMLFVELETEIKSEDTRLVIARTSFVVRDVQ